MRLLFSSVTLCLISLVFTSKQAASYDLGPEQCGRIYGAISIEFSREVASHDDIRKKMASFEEFYQTFGTTSYLFDFSAKNETTSIKKEVLSVFKGDDPTRGGSFDILVPVGSEQYIAERLIEVGIVKSAAREMGGCSATDLVALKVAKKGNFTDPIEFSQFLEKKLLRYVSQKNGESRLMGSLQKGRAVKSPIKPGYPIVTFKVVVPSEVSRSTPNQFVWDMFEIVFSLANENKSNYDVLVYAQELKTAPRTRFRETAPSKEHFRIMEENRTDNEFLVAGSVASFLAEKQEDCIVDSVLLEIDASIQFPCNGDREKLTENSQ